MRSAGRTVRSALPLSPRRAETAAMNDEAAEPGAVIRVLVAEDTRILRETLVTLFSLEDGIEVVAQVAAGTGIVPAAIEHRPDVALLDIGMPGADGLSAAAERPAAAGLQRGRADRPRDAGSPAPGGRRGRFRVLAQGRPCGDAD